MAIPSLGDLEIFTALDRPDLLAPPVLAGMRQWSRGGEALAVAIDPELADTATLIERYGLDPTSSVNCVVVSGKRAGEERIAACLVPADRRLDVNTVVRRQLDARKVSFHPHERAVEESGMEYGGITPIGLPGTWRLFLDPAVTSLDWALLGSGLRRSKVFAPGAALADLPGAELVEGLSG